MIDKKDTDRSNPKNYRPISLTNSIVKIIEKLVKTRLDKFLVDNKIISMYQSGFRNNRSTVDNLMYFAEKTYQAQFSSQRNKVCGVVFDIAKAFDKVWIAGLTYKLHQLKLPSKLGLWITNFIKGRKFFVKLNNYKSDMFNIETGVGQGTILSPTLFSLYINDITKLNEYPNDKIQSLLFADDLFSFVIDINVRRLIILMQRYLDSLEIWLNTWRMQIAPNKCSFTIYLGKVPILISNNSLSLKIYNQKISMDHQSKYLGLNMDRQLSFNQHTNIIIQKCTKHLNILRNLAYKRWALDTHQQIIVYKVLIRSCMEYASPLTQLRMVNIKTLQGIQYNALRIIFKAPLATSSAELHTRAKIETIRSRIAKLSQNYLNNANKYNNELIVQLERNRPMIDNKPLHLKSPIDIIKDNQ